MNGIPKNINRSKHHSGWTFVEMLVAVSLSAVCLGAGALAMQSIGTNAKRATSLIEVDIGLTTNKNFYGDAVTSSSLRTYIAPNFGKLMFAQEMRDKMIEDSARATAIFCLPRSFENTVRPETLALPGGERPNLDSPEAFRQFLAAAEPASVGVFTTAIRNVPEPARPSTSIFMLGASSEIDKIQVNAIYEIDVVTPSNYSSGRYMSVRRHVGSALTYYYDIFYDGRDLATGEQPFVYVPFVEFEQKSKLLGGEDPVFQRFQVAPRSPFYFIWLPDPAINPYKRDPWTAADAATSPRSTYEHMSGKTAFSLVMPMFPTL